MGGESVVKALPEELTVKAANDEHNVPWVGATILLTSDRLMPKRCGEGGITRYLVRKEVT